MGQLNIKILENSDYSYTAADNTSYQNALDKAFIEFVVKSNTIVFNKINTIENLSDLATNTKIPVDKDGYYQYYKLVIPTLKAFFEAGTSSYIIPAEIYFYNDGGIYFSKENANITSGSEIENSESFRKLSGISELWENRETEGIDFYFEDFFSLKRLINCFIKNGLDEILQYLDNNCSYCRNSDIVLNIKSKFLLCALYVLRELICKEDYDEAERLINILLSCDNFLCPEEATDFIGGGCNCGK